MRSVISCLFLGSIALQAAACADPRSEPLNEGITPPRLGPAGAVDARPAAPADGPAGTVPRDPRCPEGQHMCEQGGCVDNTSYRTCGLGCTECPGITGGTATCDGVTCGVSCPAGSKPCLDACVPEGSTCDSTNCPAGKNRCGDICVEATSLSSCGPACKPCPASPHGKSSCDGEKCDLTCDEGYHRCGEACVRDDDTDQCGSACTRCEPPTGGTAACRSNRCEAECPASTKLCFGACIAMEKSCDGMCLEGKHDCRGNCVSNTETANCGPTSCEPCLPPPNAEATCDGTTCGFTCKAGYHRCGDACKSDMSPDTCGPTECTTRCPAPTGGTATCDGKACGFRCDEGRKCDNRCIGDDTPCNGSCPSGRSLCMATGKCVPAGTITSETCDGQDNDCDGKIDDGLTDTCSNRCGDSATIRCVNGNWDRGSCPGNPRCCNSGECNDDQTCGGGTCKPLSCPKCRVADNHNCDQRQPEGTGCGGDNVCDRNGNCVPGCGRIGLRCCGSGGNGGCSQGFCGDGGTCIAKLKDGEACSMVRSNECEHQCMGYCDPVHADNRRRCLSNLECFDPVTGAESVCLEDSPECATPERR
jgi:hypothetical protein